MPGTSLKGDPPGRAVTLRENLERGPAPERRGVNVIIPSEDPGRDARVLRGLVNADGRSIFTACPPLYDRVLEDLVFVEG